MSLCQVQVKLQTTTTKKYVLSVYALLFFWELPYRYTTHYKVYTRTLRLTDIPYRVYTRTLQVTCNMRHFIFIAKYMPNRNTRAPSYQARMYNYSPGSFLTHTTTPVFPVNPGVNISRPEPNSQKYLTRISTAWGCVDRRTPTRSMMPRKQPREGPSHRPCWLFTR